jgi:hypothetical protein
MQSATDKIEQLMFIYWDTPKSPELYAFAEKILKAKERGESRSSIKRQLGSFQIETFGRHPSMSATKSSFG